MKKKFLGLPVVLLVAVGAFVFFKKPIMDAIKKITTKAPAPLS